MVLLAHAPTTPALLQPCHTHSHVSPLLGRRAAGHGRVRLPRTCRYHLPRPALDASPPATYGLYTSPCVMAAKQARESGVAGNQLANVYIMAGVTIVTLALSLPMYGMWHAGRGSQ